MSDPFLSEEDYLPYTPLPTTDPAYWMLERGRKEQAALDAGEISESSWVTKTTVYDDSCYICRDPEFALMGLPLCKPCTFLVDGVECGAHTPADDVECDNGHTAPEYIEAMEELHHEHG